MANRKCISYPTIKPDKCKASTHSTHHSLNHSIHHSFNHSTHHSINHSNQHRQPTIQSLSSIKPITASLKKRKQKRNKGKCRGPLMVGGLQLEKDVGCWALLVSGGEGKQCLQGKQQGSVGLWRKILGIFDLVVERIQIPHEIEAYLQNPLKQLRTQLRNHANTSHALEQFKKSSFHIIRKSPTASTTFFQSLPLPNNPRWHPNTPSFQSSAAKKKRNRMRGFSGLQLKEFGSVSGKDQGLVRVQRLLQQFFEGSLRYRKIYI